MPIDYCFGCAKLRPVKKTGEYKYKGVTSPILVCQWCRAAATRRRNAKLPEPFLDRKEGK